jgi:hypothetical protein
MIIVTVKVTGRRAEIVLHQEAVRKGYNTHLVHPYPPNSLTNAPMKFTKGQK